MTKHNRKRTYVKAALAVTATAVAGTLATDPKTPWYRKLAKPAWQPPGWVFPIAWTALYAAIALASGRVLADAREEGDDETRRGYRNALALNLVLNAGWSYTFFKARRLGPAVAVAAALAASSSDLARRARDVEPAAGAALAPYAAWTSFATALSASIWRRNRRR